MGQQRRPSMAEVAKHAGVSHQTVSRVINGFPGVREQTREKIERAIAELGYRRNNAARTLVTNRSGLLGVIAVGSFLYGPTRTLAGIEEAARARGYTTLLGTLQSPSKSQLDETIGSCLDRAVEAIIVIGSRDELVRHCHGLSLNVPLLVVGPSPEDLADVSSLSVDQSQGARMAIRHLQNLGHRRIAILAGPKEWVDASKRLSAAVRQCESRGTTPEVHYGDWSASSGYDFGVEISTREVQARPTAIFASNDSMALGLLLALHRTGIRVPQDMSLVGFDDIPESGFFSPPLTTVRQDFEGLGRRVVEAVTVMIDGACVQLDPLAPSLVVRDSTAPAAEALSG